VLYVLAVGQVKGFAFAGLDHPRRRRGVPGDMAAGLPGVEVDDLSKPASTVLARCNDRA
jgi:hypothetical protein